ncbi:MAG: response regulator [Cyclobacteriaceae bacterium]|nr:response regulator [Cyclobacteriaceae bacterium]
MSKEEAKILLIDDDEDILLAAKFLLKKHFTSIVTSDGPDTIDELLKSYDFDIALLDMNYTTGATSGKEGLELLKKIKKDSPSTRVIMMTAYGDIDLAIKAIKEGASDFIVKPWDNAKLVSTVLSAYKKGLSSGYKDNDIGNEQKPDDAYRKPFSEVERIFMFLDIRSSTTIAEELGHMHYFELINDFFRDIAEPISNNKGQIYQYVGDEVVVSWPLEDGLSNSNCLQCFFDIVDTMGSLTQKYLDKYAVNPSFKAGMHFGKVSTGTVGTLKKEIIYTGDVLNTASRIEGLCNKHDVDLLLSKDLMDMLPLNSKYLPKKIGEINLRGKSTEIMLFTVERSINKVG